MTLANGPLSIIGAAVTPVVMISANAILTSGMNTRYSNVADRLRTLLAEYRLSETTEPRRRAIAAQVPLFERRIGWLEFADLVLFLGTASFVATVIVISLSALAPAVAQAALPLFVVGVLLMLGGVLAELMELRSARETMRIEVKTSLQDRDSSHPRADTGQAAR